MGAVSVAQKQLRCMLGIKRVEHPCRVGALNTANGLSIVAAGSRSILTSPNTLKVGAFACLTVWNFIGILPSPRIPLLPLLCYVGYASSGDWGSGIQESEYSRLHCKFGVCKNRVFSAMVARWKIDDCEEQRAQ